MSQPIHQPAKHISKKPATDGLLQRACACGQHNHAGGECAECKKKRFSLQRYAANQAESTVVPSVVHEVLHSPGQPLDPATRAFMEPRFGHDFSQVRVHTDGKAAESARAVSAFAYTVGRDVVFGTGQYRPGEKDGRRLLAHELTHVAQQCGLPNAHGARLAIGAENDPAEAQARRVAEGAALGPLALARQAQVMCQTNPAQNKTQAGKPASPLPILPPTESFAKMWERFDNLRNINKNKEALEMAPALLRMMMGEQAIEHAGDMAIWLLQQNAHKLAEQALQDLETAWWVQFITDKGPSVPGDYIWGITKVYGPDELVEQAELQSDAGHHEVARDLFGTAYFLTQMQLIIRSNKRLASLETIRNYDEKIASGFTIFRLMSYYDESQLIARMRRVISFYPLRERKATVAGDTAKAAEMKQLGQSLRKAINEKYLLQGEGEGSRAIILEATLGNDPKQGQGYRLHGTHGKEEFVTPLPGEPLPDELGKHPVYTASMQELTNTLTGQEDFITEVLQNPKVRAAFGNKTIHMNNLKTRISIWKAMFDAYQARPTPGCPTALCSLLRLIERYLHSFTFHTSYNIRDFGVNYLYSTFPEDLAGRVARDCGVYAVTVAYEVFRTARGAKPPLPVGFQLYSTMEHTMLVITDQGANQHYVVSNDQIEGPRSGDASGTVAEVYAGVIGRTPLITAAGRSQPLDSKMSDASFRTEIWQRYQAGAHLGLRPEAKKGSDDTRTAVQREADAYTHYYQAMGRFERLGNQANRLLDELQAQLGKLSHSAQGGTMRAAVPSLTRIGGGMVLIFEQFMSKTNIGLRSGATRSVEQVLLTNAGLGQTTHPLVRIAKALLFYQGLGNPLTREQQTLVKVIRSAPLPSFATDLAVYVQAGRPPTF